MLTRKERRNIMSALPKVEGTEALNSPWADVVRRYEKTVYETAHDAYTRGYNAAIEAAVAELTDTIEHLSEMTSSPHSSLATLRSLRELIRALKHHMNSLKPCPFCGSTNVVVAWGGLNTFVWCQNCDAQGPLLSYENEGTDMDCEPPASQKRGAALVWNKRSVDALIKMPKEADDAK